MRRLPCFAVHHTDVRSCGKEITAPTKALVTKEQALAAAQTDTSFDVLATVGAGDIDTLVPQLKLMLTERWK